MFIVYFRNICAKYTANIRNIQGGNCVCSRFQQCGVFVMFYYNFVELCNKKGVSPSAAAEEIGLHRSQVTRWKNECSMPRQSTLQKMCAYFGFTIDDLTKEAEAKKDIAAEAVMSLRDLMRRMSKDELLTLIADAAEILRDK